MGANPRSVIPGVVGSALRRLEDFVRELARRVDEVSDAVPSITYGTTAGTACEGNDSRLSDARTPTAHAASHLPGGTDALTTVAAGAIQPDDSASAGSAASFARSDHKHSIVAATAGAATPGDSAAEGSATSFSRSDHKHSLPAFGTASGTFCQGDDSRLSDSRAPSGTAGGDLSGTYPNPGVNKLKTTGTSVTVGTAAPPTAGQFLKASSATAAEWANVSGVTIASERWVRPATAHADDEEFETASLSNFTLYDSTGTAVASQPANTTIDPYANDTTNHHADANVFRPGWLTFKCRNNNARFYYVKSHTSPTNQCSYTRIGMKSRPSPNNNEDDIALMLMAATAGHPDPNNRVELIWQQTTSGRRIVARITSAGVDNTVFTGTAFGTEWELYSYIIIHKLGTTYHFWLAGDSGGWSYLGSGSFTGTVAYVGYMFQTNGSTPGNGLNQTDFLRFVDSATFIP